MIKCFEILFYTEITRQKKKRPSKGNYQKFSGLLFRMVMYDCFFMQQKANDWTELSFALKWLKQFSENLQFYTYWFKRVALKTYLFSKHIFENSHPNFKVLRVTVNVITNLSTLIPDRLIKLLRIELLSHFFTIVTIFLNDSLIKQINLISACALKSSKTIQP